MFRGLSRFVPSVDWIRTYPGTALRGDLSAGLTVGVMLIPQGMAYALIAGLPPIYGLYASLTPLVLYGLFGTSHQLAVGPVAMVSLLVAAGVAPLAGGNVETYIGLALLVSLMVGAMQFGLGVARFGFLVNFLSHPVLVGFTSAAALIIGLGQLKHLLGIPIPQSKYVHEILWAAVSGIGGAHGLTLVVGLAAVVLIVVLRRWKKTFPGALLAVVLGIASAWLFRLDELGIAIVGGVQGGLPGFLPPPVSLDAMRSLLPTALTIALVGFMESIAVAKVYASRNRYEVDANQELIALGLANIVGSFFRAFPTTGGFSRTAVNAAAGARTNLAGLISAGVIALALLFLTPLFHFLPNAILAAVVIVAVAALIDFKEIRFLWKVDRRDFVLLAVTFFATLTLGIEEGILVGVILSLALVIEQSTHPHTAVMGRLPGSTVYRNVGRHADALVDEEVLIVRMDASMYFANAAHTKDTLRRVGANRPGLKAIVLDMYPVNRIDSTAAHSLKEMIIELRERGVELYLTGVKGPVRDMLTRSNTASLLGDDRFFHEVHDAFCAAKEHAKTSVAEDEPAMA